MPFAEQKGAQIHYEEAGAGFPLVLLADLGEDLASWEPHRAVYTERYRCISVDARGIGGSTDGGPRLTTAAMAEDVKAVMQHAGVEEAHVAGIGLGGAVAQVLAAQNPAMVRTLTLVSTFASYPLDYCRQIVSTLANYYGTGSRLAYEELLALFLFAPKSFLFQPELMAARKAALSDDTPFPMTADAFRAQASAMLAHDALAQLRKIHAPTLIVGGEDDVMVPPGFLRELANAIPPSALALQPGGHAYHLEDLQKFNELTLEFLVQMENPSE